MSNYTTELKAWGDTGQEYPDNYSYKDKEQPVDHWDNFFAYNVIEDLNHLIDITNNDLVQREGGALQSDLDVGTYSLTGEAGSVMFSGTELSIDAEIDARRGLTVNESIEVGGTVDGVDVSTFQSNTNTELSNLDSDLQALDTNFTAHENNLENPHDVTHTQVGAPSQTSFDTLSSDYDSHIGDNSAHHERYSNTEAREAIDGYGLGVVSATERIENATVATEDDLPSSAPEGAQIYVEENDEVYVYTE